MSRGLFCAMPSWVRLPSIKAFPGVPKPHLGKFSGPQSTATSLQRDVSC